jgi:hypothetical protein
LLVDRIASAETGVVDLIARVCTLQILVVVVEQGCAVLAGIARPRNFAGCIHGILK